jgi:hypothetical protein
MSKSLTDEILIRGLEDIIQLAEVISVAQLIQANKFGPMESTVCECVRSLVDQGSIVVGDLDTSNSPLRIRPWSGDSNAIVDRINREWSALGRDPGLAEICWLQLTIDGRNRGEKLSAE